MAQPAASSFPPPSAGRMLLIKISSLGDIVHAFPAATLMAEQRPGWELDWLCGEAFLALPRLHPGVAEVIPFARQRLGSWSGFPAAFGELRRHLRQRRYDLIVDFQGLFRSAACARLARGGEVVGFAHPRERLAALAYHRRITPPPTAVHAVDRNLALAAAALGQLDAPQPPRWQLAEGQAATVAASALLANAGLLDPAPPLVAVVPGARWPTKQWPPEFFAAVLAEVGQACPTCRFLILGSAAEAVLAAGLAATVGARAVNLAGRTDLVGLVALIRRCRAMFCNDTGPMHLAAALAVPVYAMFGATDPARTGPYGPGQVFLAQPGCNPCFRRYCPEPENRCHVGIAATDVAASLIAELTLAREKSSP